MAWVRLAFAAYHFRVEADWKEFSGLVVPGLVGSQRLVLGLDFTRSPHFSFLFSDTLAGRFPFQPAYSPLRSASKVVYEDYIENSFGWTARQMRDTLRLGTDGGGPETQETFGLVEHRSVSHWEYQEVAGVLSFTRNARMTENKLLSFQFKPNGRVTVASLGRRRVPWPMSTVSLGLSGSSWTFEAGISLGDEILNFETVLVDPSSADLLLPLRLWSLVRRTGQFELVGDAKRLHAMPGQDLNLSFHQGARKLDLSRCSLSFPSGFSLASDPLRVRFVSDTEHVVLGRALLESYKHVYLDNVEQKIHLVPRLFSLSAPTRVPARSSLVLEPPHVTWLS